MKVIALILSFLQLVFTGVGYGSVQTGEEPVKPGEILLNDISDDGILAPSVLYAASVRNGVQGYYNSSEKTSYTVENNNLLFCHTLGKGNVEGWLFAKDGSVLIKNSFDAFYTDASGRTHYANRSTGNVFANTVKLGEYFYETHIRDLNFCSLSSQKAEYYLDKTLSVYADALYYKLTLLAAEAGNAPVQFGSEIKIPVCTVDSLCIKDKNGEHSDAEKIDSASVEYAAFSIKDSGVAGFIVPSDGSAKEMKIEKKGAYYFVTLLASYDTSAKMKKFDETGDGELFSVSFGCRIYADETSSFDGIRAVAEIERNPLTGISVAPGNSEAEYCGYDALTGAYTIKANGIGFNYAYENPELQYSIPIKIENPDSRNIYIKCRGANGCLEAAVLLDENNALVAEDVEVCKNFCGDFGEPVNYYTFKDYEYGESYFPLSLTEGQNYKLTLLNLWQNWGRYPLKQLSSIEFGNPYYHLSTGTTESNCIAPYLLDHGWSLPDFRGRSGEMWSSQPQFNSVGVLSFCLYRKNILGFIPSDDIVASNTGSRIASTGLCYSDITTLYSDDRDAFDYTVRHVEFPQTDENRTYINLDITFRRDMKFANFSRDFDLFYFDGRFVQYNSFGYLNADNKCTSDGVVADGKNRYFALGSESPYYSFYNVTAETEPYIDKCFGSSFGLIVRSGEFVLNGKKTELPLALRVNADSEKTSGCLTINKQRLDFSAGDTIHLELVLLPWGTGRETNDENVRTVREDSALDRLTVDVSKGTAGECSIVPTVYAENNEAEFTVSGGRNNTAVRIDGLTAGTRPAVTVNGEPVAEASSNGYDGYTLYYNSDGTYGVSFIYEAVPGRSAEIRLKTNYREQN